MHALEFAPEFTRRWFRTPRGSAPGPSQTGNLALLSIFQFRQWNVTLGTRATSFVSVAAAVCLFANLVHGQSPIGFERWTEPPDSGIVFNQEFADLFAEYSNPASTISGTLFAPGIKGLPARRLIDIEIHSDGPFAHNVADAVWVENSGGFQIDSWLVNRMTQAQLLQWPNYRAYVILDLERYQRNGRTLWAAIVQRNLHQVPWGIVLEVSIDAINAVARDNDMRVVDVDFVGYGQGTGCNPGEACIVPIYDAVLVENSGANHVDWNLEEGWNYEPHVASEAQLIDREKDISLSGEAAWWSAYLSVFVDNEYETYEFLNEFDVLFNHGHVLHRVIDLELDPAIPGGDPEFPSYYTVNIVP
jgi:hypothetical protein